MFDGLKFQSVWRYHSLFVGLDLIGQGVKDWVKED
jgi:hypothetical protein